MQIQKNIANKNSDYFELYGYGDLIINNNNQNINLINETNNTVFLNYRVYFDDSLLYETGLIYPGKMEQCNVYSLLEKGSYTLTYLINVYDENNKLLWRNIKQEQNILIE